MPYIDSDEAVATYISEGEQKALQLGNRGPIRFDDDGTLEPEILDAFWKYGFYVLEGALGKDELDDLQADLERVFERAPRDKDATVDSKGRPAIGSDLAKSPFRFSKPLSDPNGGTANANATAAPGRGSKPQLGRATPA